MRETFEYLPSGVCSQHMRFDIEDNRIVDFEVIGGCNGNLKGIKSLILGMDVNEVIKKLSGIECGMKMTSCPDQISKALSEYVAQH